MTLTTSSTYASCRFVTLIFVGVIRHLQRQMTSHSLVSGRNSSTFGDASDDFVNLRVLLDSSYAHFRRRKTWYRSIDVHFRGQTNSHSLVSGLNASIFGDDSEDFVNLRILLDSGYVHCRRRKLNGCRTIYVHFRGQKNSQNLGFRFSFRQRNNEGSEDMMECLISSTSRHLRPVFKNVYIIFW